MQISDNLDFKPENYLLGFDTVSYKITLVIQSSPAYVLAERKKYRFSHQKTSTQSAMK